MALVSDKRISTTDYESVTVLLCPRCGGEYLHHVSATMFDRPEDGETAKRSFIDGTSAKVDLVPVRQQRKRKFQARPSVHQLYV